MPLAVYESSCLSALFRRMAARRGNKRAILAVAHAMPVIAYYLLKRKEEYKELGVNYFDQLNAEGLRRSLVRRLDRLGHQATLQPRPVTPRSAGYFRRSNSRRLQRDHRFALSGLP